MEQKQILRAFLLKNLLIFGVFVCTFAVLLIFAENFGEVNRKANISDLRDPVEIVREAIELKGQEEIDELIRLSGGREFAEEIKDLGEVFDLKAEQVTNGFIISFTATIGSGDALHPFYGFFETVDNVIGGILWSARVTGEVVERGEQIIKVRNTGPFAWGVDNVWENFQTGSPVFLESIDNKELIEVGDVGIFVVDPMEIEKFSPQNLTHGYVIEIQNSK